MFSKFKYNKQYVNCYVDMIKNEDIAMSRIDSFIENCKSNAYINKTRILKLYVELHKGLDYSETLKELNLKDLFFVNDHFSHKETMWNADSFLWLMILMAKAKDNNELLDEIVNKLNYQELDHYLEPQEIKALRNCLENKEDKGIKFFNDLLKGEYTKYKYDKRLIGLYKRFAASSLAYLNELNDDYYMDDIRDFGLSMIGKTFMQDLGILEKYPVQEQKEAIHSEE